MAQLPDEIVLAISANASVDTLLSLQRTSRGFYRTITTEIYRSIRFTGSSSPPRLVLNEWDYHYTRFLCPPTAALTFPTEVRSLTCLLRTIRESQLLRSLIQYFAFELGAVTTTETISQIAEAIGLTKSSLRELHIAPDMYLEETLQTKPPMTSLSLDLRSVLRHRDSWMEAKQLLSLFKLLFRQNTLTSLSVAAVGYWGWSGEILTYPHTQFVDGSFQEIQSFSNLTSLAFSHSAPSGVVLVKILSWPKALKSFYLEAVVLWEEFSDVVDISAKEFFQALSPQSSSLEEVFIFTNEIGPGFLHMSTTGSLRHFVNLKRLGVSWNWIRGSDDELSNYAAQERFSCSHDLPPSLQELQLQFHDVCRSSPGKTARSILQAELSKENAVHKCDGQLIGFFLDIVSLKIGPCTRLRRLVIWEGKQSWGNPKYIRLGDLDPYRELVDIFKAANIEFQWFVSGAPPMFSPWRQEQWLDVTDEYI